MFYCKICRKRITEEDEVGMMFVPMPEIGVYAVCCKECSTFDNIRSINPKRTATEHGWIV